MSFDVAAEAYDRFMGRFSSRLSAPFADLAGVEDGQRVLDVGSGPGALTAELVQRLGPESVAAVDPSEPFVAAARSVTPRRDVRLAPAEELPHADDEFDAALAQLVVHFMAAPVAGLTEMARVTRSGGVVAACVWDLAAGARRSRPSGRPCTSSTARSRTSRASRARARAISSSSSAPQGCARCRRRRSRPPRSTRASRSGGARTRSGGAGRRLRAVARRRAAGRAARPLPQVLPEAPFTLTAYAWAVRGRA